jgi:cation diffusion facilitator CzcD-associated flavoprotein CzcO
VTEHPDPSFAIIGAGFGGIGMAIELLRSGHRDVTIFEARDGVGGVWRANTYPGAACDVPSHLYSFSFDLNPEWSRKFSPQPEILAYLENVAERHDLAPHLRCNTRVVRAEWEADRSRWRLTTDDGTVHHAEVLVAATGQLRLPRYPDLPGRDDFRGTQFHSAEWDHDHRLSGERVAVIGTGASAIQFVPEIVGEVSRLFVFQRSAPWVLPKPDRAFTEQEKERFRRHPRLMQAYRQSIFARFDARFPLLFGRRSPGARMLELAEGKYLEAVVKDPDLRRALTPTDHPGCKRLLMSNDWYRALVEPQVEVVTDPIQRITGTGVRTASGREIGIDTIVWGTGFRASDFLVPMEVIGREGHHLHRDWDAGAEAYLGMAVPDHPNLFILYGPNTNLGHNSILYMIESQIAYIIQAAALLRDSDVRSVEVRPHVARAYNDTVQADLAETVWAAGCDSWYTTDDGRNTQNWSGRARSYRRRTRHFDPADYLLTRVPADPRRSVRGGQTARGPTPSIPGARSTPAG